MAIRTDHLINKPRHIIARPEIKKYTSVDRFPWVLGLFALKVRALYMEERAHLHSKRETSQRLVNCLMLTWFGKLSTTYNQM